MGTQRPRHRGALLVVGALLLLAAAQASAQAPLVAQLVADIRPGPADGLADIFVYWYAETPMYCTGYSLVGGEDFLWLVGDDGPTGREPWRSDGTVGGTFLIADVDPGAESPFGCDPSFTLIDGLLYFVIDDAAHGRELWRSDGTAEGTHPLLDIWPGPADSSPWSITEFNGLFYFSAIDPDHGRELWRSDGTAEGTELVIDLHPGETDTNPGGMTVSNGTLFFSGTIGATEYVDGRGSLWRTDGTPEGTHAVRAFRPGDSAWRLTDLGGTLLFVVSYTFDPALWRSDGTSRGTIPLYHFGRHHFLRKFVVAGDLLFFQVDDMSWRDDVLWRSDGTAEGTFSLGGTIRRGPPPIPVGDRVLFVREVGDKNWGELCVTDGTPEGTVPLKILRPGSGSWALFEYLPAGEEVWFVADDGVHGLELWKTDGTPEGTVLAVDLVPGRGSLAPSHLTLVGDRLFFAGDDGVHGRELWTIGVLVSAISIPTLDAWGLVALALVLLALGILLLRRWRSTSYSECQATRDSTSPHHAT
ncbi:MAG: IPTL-CTERM sorting domain-containing protein [bacterium]|nr:IPTL-CTERM sorting domain-containing protein [bacterium]